MKNGPEDEPLTSVYLRIAVTGQRGRPVFPKIMSAPVPNWSHFDLLRWILISVGLSLLSTATSPHMSYLTGETEACVSGSSSPSLKKPKNVVQQIAHRRSFWGWLDWFSCVRICSMTAAVMGRRRWDGGPLSALTRWIPAWILFSTGRDDCSLGSGSSRESCVLRTADRYSLIVCGARPSSAR